MTQKKPFIQRMKDEFKENDHVPSKLEVACAVTGVIVGATTGFALLKYNGYQYGSGNLPNFWASTTMIDALSIGGLLVGDLTGRTIDYFRGYKD